MEPEPEFRPLGSGRWLADKATSLGEAVAVVEDGQTVAFGGMTLFRRPVAAAVELVRRAPRELTLLDYTGAYEGDILIGAGCVSRVRSCYFGLDVLGLAPMHRIAIQEGRIEVVEETEATVALGLRAARAHVDFLPGRILAGTDIPKVRPDLRTTTSPYSGKEYIAVPALVPDVTFVHAVSSDAAGNAVLGSEYSLDVDMAAAARHTVVTAERIVPTSEIEEEGADLLGAFVDAVVELPGGARPTSCFPDYEVDLEFLADYVEACRAGEFERFLAERVLEVG